MPVLDSILNFSIPFVVIIGMVFLIYKACSEPIDRLFFWVRGMIQEKRANTSEAAQQVYSEIIYE